MFKSISSDITANPHVQKLVEAFTTNNSMIFDGALLTMERPGLSFIRDHAAEVKTLLKATMEQQKRDSKWFSYRPQEAFLEKFDATIYATLAATKATSPTTSATTASPFFSAMAASPSPTAITITRRPPPPPLAKPLKWQQSKLGKETQRMLDSAETDLTTSASA